MTAAGSIAGGGGLGEEAAVESDVDMVRRSGVLYREAATVDLVGAAV